MKYREPVVASRVIVAWENISGSAIRVRSSDILAWLRVESQEVARLRARLPGRDEDDARRRADEDAGRGGDVGVQCERDALRVPHAVLEGRVEEFHHQMVVVNSPRDSQRDMDGRHIRSRMEEGLFG